MATEHSREAVKEKIKKMASQRQDDGSDKTT
jgi:hypothetical protein